jgi:hypothetical protein
MKERYLMAKYGQVLPVISKWKKKILMFEMDLTVTEYGPISGSPIVFLGSRGSTKREEFLDELNV